MPSGARLPEPTQHEALDRPLRVAALVATRKGDPERGPLVVMNPKDAADRLVNEGDLAWVYGPRRHDLATVRVDERTRFGDVVLRDIVGASPSETVRVIRPDMDQRGRRPAGHPPR